EALAAAGYPLGEAGAAAAAGSLPMAGESAGFAPSFQVEKSAEGALVTYNCPCGSTTEEYTYDRSQAEQAVGSCCDHHLLIQPAPPSASATASARATASPSRPSRCRGGSLSRPPSPRGADMDAHSKTD